MHCKHCPTGTATREIVMTSGPHYGKLECTGCGRFIGWMATPQVPFDRMKIPDPLPPGKPLPPLEGTPNQIKWAQSLRSDLLGIAVKVLPANVWQGMKTITDSGWWIANANNPPTSYKWPRSWIIR